MICNYLLARCTACRVCQMPGHQIAQSLEPRLISNQILFLIYEKACQLLLSQSQIGYQLLLDNYNHGGEPIFHILYFER